jgi:hypothetical protein
MPISDPGLSALLTPAPFIQPTQRIEFAFSLDGGASAATSWIPVLIPEAGGQVLAGGVSESWGRSWLWWEFGQPGFALMARRPAAEGESSLTPRLLDHAYVGVHHAAGAAVNMSSQRISSNQRILFGRESTRGTQVTAASRAMAARIEFSPNLSQSAIRSQGDRVDQQYPVLMEDASGSLSGKACFNEIGWWLSTALTKPLASTPSSGVFEHEFTPAIAGLDDPNTFTFEVGDTVRAHRVSYAMLAGLTLGGARDQEPGISGDWFARAMTDGISMSAGANEVQTLTVSGSPTSFRLKYRGVRSAVINVTGLSASAIQTAIQAITTVGTGNMLVSGTGPYTITAASALAGQELERLEVVDQVGTGTITIVKTTPGGHTRLPVIPILSNPQIFVADSLAGLEAGALGGVSEHSFEFKNGRAPVWYQDGSTSWADYKEVADDVQSSISFKIEADSGGMANLPRARSQDLLYVRVRHTGPQIAVGFNNMLEITLAARVQEVEPFSDQDGIYSYGYKFGAVRDAGLGWATKLILRNSVSSYTS